MLCEKIFFGTPLGTLNLVLCFSIILSIFCWFFWYFDFSIVFDTLFGTFFEFGTL